MVELIKWISDSFLKKQIAIKNTEFIKLYKESVVKKIDELPQDEILLFKKEMIIRHLDEQILHAEKYQEEITNTCYKILKTETEKELMGIYKTDCFNKNYFDKIHHCVHKFSRDAAASPFGEYYFHQYKEHTMEDLFENLEDDIDAILARLEWLAGRSSYENEIRFFENEKYKCEFMRQTGYIDDRGYCFVRNPEKMLTYLSYGNYLTIGIVDPLLNPNLEKTICNLRPGLNIEYKLSNFYVSQNIELEPYILKKILFFCNDWTDIALIWDPPLHHSAQKDMVSIVQKLLNGITKDMQNKTDVKLFFERLQELFLSHTCFNKVKEKMDEWYPPSADPYPDLFCDDILINKERMKQGIQETIQESRYRIFPKELKEKITLNPQFQEMYCAFSKYFSYPFEPIYPPVSKEIDLSISFFEQISLFIFKRYPKTGRWYDNFSLRQIRFIRKMAKRHKRSDINLILYPDFSIYQMEVILSLEKLGLDSSPIRNPLLSDEKIKYLYNSILNGENVSDTRFRNKDTLKFTKRKEKRN